MKNPLEVATHDECFTSSRPDEQQFIKQQLPSCETILLTVDPNGLHVSIGTPGRGREHFSEIFHVRRRPNLSAEGARNVRQRRQLDAATGSSSRISFCATIFFIINSR